MDGDCIFGEIVYVGANDNPFFVQCIRIGVRESYFVVCQYLMKFEN